MSGNDLYFFLAGAVIGWLIAEVRGAIRNRRRRKNAERQAHT